ncbi:hypothetical protein ATCC90586_002184 [Pythium insidiosum]|nr:hypothetical protein ATCC90586_002184 [Pythium insidiosum]
MSILPAPPPSAPQSSSLPARILVSPPAFIAFWWCILVLHLGCILFAALLGGLHAYTAIPANYTYSRAALRIPRHFLLLGARTFAGIGLLHAAVVARIFFNSVKRRQLCFRAELQAKPQGRVATFNPLYWLLWAPLRWLNARWERVFGIDGLFGLNGPHFEAAFYVRKTTEILSQTYQAYYLSVLLANRFINSLAVGVILTACFTAPIMRRAFPQNRASRRFASLLLDLALDICSSVVIPLYTLYSSMKEFEWSKNQYPIELSFNSVWLARQTAQGRFLLIWSTLDFLSTTILQFSLLGGILITARCLRRSDSVVNGDPGAPIKVAPASTWALDPSPALAGAPTKTLLDPGSRGRRRLPVSPVELLFLSWGLFVLIAHLGAQANAAQHIARCQLAVLPWFTARPACSVVAVNCHREQIAGAIEETTPLLEPLDARTVTSIVVTHCPAWTMPPVIQRFQQLQKLVLYNVTIQSWARSAALQQRFHPELSHIFMGEVRMAEFPPGMLHEDVPRSLTNVEVSITNLSVLPETLGVLWADNEWVRFHWENSPLVHVPESIWRLGVRRFSFINSQIEELPADAFAHASVEIIRLSGNPLRALPPLLRDSQTLHRVTCERTKLTELPAWVERWWRMAPVGRRISFRGTPLCLNNNSSLPSDFATAICTTTYEDEEQGIVPWAEMRRLHPVE